MKAFTIFMTSFLLSQSILSASHEERLAQARLISQIESSLEDVVEEESLTLSEVSASVSVNHVSNAAYSLARESKVYYNAKLETKLHERSKKFNCSMDYDRATGKLRLYSCENMLNTLKGANIEYIKGKPSLEINL